MKKILGLVMIFILMGSLTSLSIIQADDHDDEYEYEYEYNDDEYDGDDGYYEELNSGNGFEEGNWYLWNREAVSNKVELPFKDAKNVRLKMAGGVESLSSYVMPLQGEFFIPAKAVSQFLGAAAIFYEKSSILEITSAETELIFRANTNVVYENGLKTKLPGKSFYLNKDVYLPISVIANGLGYAVEWKEQENTFVFQAL